MCISGQNLWLPPVSQVERGYKADDRARADMQKVLERVERERELAREAQKQAAADARSAMQDQIDAINERPHKAMVAQAAAQAEADSLRSFRDANNQLYEIIGVQKATIAMLENKIADLQNRCTAQSEQILEYQKQESE